MVSCFGSPALSIFAWELNFYRRSILTAPAPIPSGEQLYVLDLQVFVFNPVVATEIVVKDYKTSRFLLTAGGGDAFASLTNAYTMTTYGQSALGMSSHSESATGNAINFFGSIGYEFHWMDSVMLMTEAGYRYMPIKNFVHSTDEKTFAQPNGATKGSPFLNADGSQAKIDLSGGFVGLSIVFICNRACPCRETMRLSRLEIQVVRAFHIDRCHRRLSVALHPEWQSARPVTTCIGRMVPNAYDSSKMVESVSVEPPWDVHGLF